MFDLTPVAAVLSGLGFIVLAVLMTIWWRQQTYRGILVTAICVLIAPLLSWWSGLMFILEDYRAGCDGLCPGFAGAPIPYVRGEAAGGQFVLGLFVVNSLAYLVFTLAWSMALRAFLANLAVGRRGRVIPQLLAGGALVVLPLAVSPWVLPSPEAHVRGDPQRIAINAQREIYLYAHQASAPILRAGLADVRPRRDGSPGMRVCLRIYSLFYLPIGHMVLDMTPEGVHSDAGGVVPPEQTCWQ